MATSRFWAKSNPYARGYRSGLEDTVHKQLKAAGIPAEYEPKDGRISYIPKTKTYLPDFVLPGGLIIETKGRFLSEDRTKHLLIKQQNPGLDIRFVFTNPFQRLSKASKTTYADWCDKHGFQWAKGLIPDEWLREITHEPKTKNRSNRRA